MIFIECKKIYIDRVSNDCILSDNKFVKIYNFLIINGYEILDVHDDSDLVILDLCGVNTEFLDVTEMKIKFYLSLNKKIMLFGCVSNIFKERYKDQLFYLESKNFKNLQKILKYSIGFDNLESVSFKNKISILNTDNYLKNYSDTLLEFEKISFISISDGCSLNCSYCNIKKIKGDTLSENENNILDEVRKGLEKGKNNIYLLSDDCGSYGVDKGTNIVELIDKILKIDNNITLNITNIYPSFFLKYYKGLKKYIYSNKILSIVLPLQHTSSRILSLMNRYYNIDSLIDILDDIKSKSKVQLQNHIIFDYYEETIEEFVDTFKLLNYYDKNFYFRYSDINNIYGKKASENLKEKIILLKKLQNKYNIDITL